MTEMVDRVAAALANFEINDWRTASSPAKWADMATAAVEAMREPTDAMCDAATRSTSAWLNSKLKGVELRRLKLRIRWGAMIDEALRK